MVERGGAVTRSQKWKESPQCSNWDSCSFRHDTASGNRCEDHRSKGQSSSPAPNSKAQNGGQKKPPKVQALLEHEEEVRVKIAFGESVRTRHVVFGTPPVFSITSLNQGWTFGDRSHVPTRWGGWAAQQKVEERWCERIRCLVDGVYTHGLCVSRFLSEKVYSMERRKIAIKSHRQKSEQQRVHWEHLFKKCEPHERTPCAPKVWGKSTRRNLATRKMRPQSSMGLSENFLQAQKISIKLRFTLLMKPRQCQRPPQNFKRNENLRFTPEHQCTCSVKGILSQLNWTLFEGPGIPHRS